MPVTIGVLRESAPQESRVSLVPEVAAKFAALGARVLIERGAGAAAHFPDALYKQVDWADSAGAVLAMASRTWPARVKCSLGRWRLSDLG